MQTGVGLDKAAAACRAVLQKYEIGLVVSAGLAGALTPARIGELLIGTDVRIEADDRAACERMRHTCSSEAVTSVQQMAARMAMPTHIGSFVTSLRILWHAAEKQAVAERTGAIAVDMESAMLGAGAAGLGIPFAIARHVSDLRDESLPVNLNLFTRPADRLTGVVACVANPSCLAGLWRLRRQMHAATEAMSLFYSRWLDELSESGKG